MSQQDFNQIFAANLNYYLSVSPHTRTELAEYVGVSTASISNWCKGIKLPRMDKVDKMCDFFGITRAKLLHDYSESAPTSSADIHRKIDLLDEQDLDDLNDYINLKLSKDKYKKK
ncbi:MAG: helix-turn-helix transcriptional regulator [Lachnospiraceae bacterium]|nr:helix-turn-helix transcriptional regulator [Lachnospiraceae bacterium]